MLVNANSMVGRITRFCEDSDASAITEYGILLGLVALTVVASIVGIGLAAEGSFEGACQHILSALFRTRVGG
jgi:Flp pilus assembly pilin Flp